MIAPGFDAPRSALTALAALPQGRWFVWFQGRLAVEAHQSRDLRCVVECLNYLAHRGAIDCRQSPLDDPENQKRAWRHYVARRGDVDIPERLLPAVVRGEFTAGKRRDGRHKPENER